LKRNARNGFDIYVVHINERKYEVVKIFLIEDPILQEFRDVFSEKKIQDYLLEGTYILP